MIYYFHSLKHVILYCNTGEARYVESNRTPGGWHSTPASSKSFNSVTTGGSRDPRNEPSSWSSRSSDSVNRYAVFTCTHNLI